MSSTQRHDAKDAKLTESWEEVRFPQQSLGSSSMFKSLPPGTIEQKLLEAQQLTPPKIIDPALCKPVSHGTMEKLLLEAQKEWSRNSSRVGSNVGSCTSSRSSPKSPRSPTNELSGVVIGETSAIQVERIPEGTDWIWDWSSRPEVVPPGDIGGPRYKHPVKKSQLSVRNTVVMRSGPFCMENLPIMLLTHACTFFLGAAVMFVYLKKYCGWSSSATVIID